jgi:hypothetical protein
MCTNRSQIFGTANIAPSVHACEGTDLARERRRIDQALYVVGVEAYVNGVSTRACR